MISQTTPDALSKTNSAAPDAQAPEPPAPDPGSKEYGGREALDPTRYGDWEKNGRCIDF